MKVLHIDTATTWRGGEKQALELIRGLNKLGVKNLLACRPNSEISKRAININIDVVHFPLRGEWDIFSSFQLRSFIIKNKIDIVHTHTSHAHGIVFFALYDLDTCKLIVSRRVDFHLRSFYSRKVKYGSFVDKFIAISDAIRRVLIDDGIDSRRIVVIRDGFVKDEYINHPTKRDLKEELNISDDAIVIVTVAALAPHKSHYLLIMAAYEVVKKHPKAIFLFAGEGEMRDSIERNINELGIENSVKLLGSVEDIDAVYKVADIFALSSSEEGLCSSLYDAMYFKLPIVATGAGGIPEIVLNNINGFIVPVGDYKSFAERLNVLIENPDLRRKMDNSSLSLLAENSIDHMVEKTLAVYHEVLDNKNLV